MHWRTALAEVCERMKKNLTKPVSNADVLASNGKLYMRRLIDFIFRQNSWRCIWWHYIECRTRTLQCPRRFCFNFYLFECWCFFAFDSRASCILRRQTKRSFDLMHIFELFYSLFTAWFSTNISHEEEIVKNSQWSNRKENTRLEFFILFLGNFYVLCAIWPVTCVVSASHTRLLFTKIFIWKNKPNTKCAKI